MTTKRTQRARLLQGAAEGGLCEVPDEGAHGDATYPGGVDALEDGCLLPGQLPGVDFRVYEYGLRLHAGCEELAVAQMRLAQQLYNELVAALRGIHADMSAWVLEQAGPQAQALQARLDAIWAEFGEAKAANDDAAMQRLAQERRGLWPALAALLAGVRKQHAAELRSLFYARIGRGAACDTYLLRCKAVEAGLGWSTANDVLERSLVAWKDSMKRGQPPRFSAWSERMQDTLSLQFTEAGGVDVVRLLEGLRQDFVLRMPARTGRRCYGEFRFRLGAAAAQQYATGSVQVHRDLPAGAAVGVRLVRRRNACRCTWALQLLVRLREPVQRPCQTRGRLAAVHFGWSAHDSGRCVAGVADGADPDLVRLVHLPLSVEADLERAGQVQGQRDRHRVEAVPALKVLAEAMRHRLAGQRPAGAAELGGAEVGAVPDGRAASCPPALPDLDREVAIKSLDTLLRLGAAQVAAHRFYRMQTLLRQLGEAEPEWLREWVAADRKRWQANVGLQRKARARRRHFYRELALDLSRGYSAIVIEPLDLAAAARKVDEHNGERTDFLPAARAGRTVVALYELEMEIRKAAAEHGRALFELNGARTVSTCAHCGAAAVRPRVDDPQKLACSACGAVTERKRAGAARAWQLCIPGIEDRVVDFHSTLLRQHEEAAAAKAERKVRMAQGRRDAKQARERTDGL